jgi:hypothetical protein
VANQFQVDPSAVRRFATTADDNGAILSGDQSLLERWVTVEQCGHPSVAGLLADFAYARTREGNELGTRSAGIANSSEITRRAAINSDDGAAASFRKRSLP